MERFAKVAFGSKKSKLNILCICRCCGLAGVEMYCINLTDIDDDFTLTQKIRDLLAIDVKDHDKMPPNICSLCMDKITDFYEFRLMSLNTEKQTRAALGLPPYVNPNTQIKEVIKIVHVKEPAPKTVALVPVLKKINVNQLLAEKAGRSRKYEEDTPSSEDEVVPVSRRGKQKASRVEAVVTPPPAKKSKKDIPCSICLDQYFGFQSDLNDHLIKEHSPTVAKYGCASCREQFSTQGQLKEHDQWHNKNKEPYFCFQCNETFAKALAFNRHMAPYKCVQAIQLPVTVDDIKCFQCKKKFITENLFEWHSCYIKSKATCPKCNKFYAKKPALFKHYLFCDAKNFDLKRNLERGEEMGKNKKRKVIKQEKLATETAIQSITHMLSTVDSEIAKLQKKKKKQDAEFAGEVTNIVKSEISFEEEQLEERDENMEEEDINYDDYYENGDDFQQNGDSGDEYTAGSGPSSPSPSTMEPQVSVEEGETPTIRIKQERLDPAYGDKEAAVDINVLRNIKKEPNPEARNAALKKHQIIQKKKQEIALLLKIKQEGGRPGASKVSVLNPMAIKKKPMDLKKKLFKIPANLMRNIKKEKMHSGYGDDGVRDEAEADEDSNDSYVEEPIIKQEKMDESYGDDMDDNASVMSTSSMLLNPMAVVRQKNLAAAQQNLQNGASEDSQPLGLVISSVGSILNMEANENELLTNRSENENENSNDIQNENGSEADVPEPAPAKTKFKPIRIKQELQIAKVQSRYEESPEEEQSDQFDYSSADRGTALQSASTMVEIPSEFHNSEEQISTPTSPSPQTSALIDEPMLEESSPIPDDPNITDNSPMPEESEENLLNETIEADEPLSPGAEAALLEEFSQPPPTAPAELDIMNILDNLNSELTQQKRKEDEQLTIDSLLNDMDGNVPSTSE